MEGKSGKTLVRFIVFSLLIMLVGCLTTSSNNLTLLYQEHQLVGKLWDVKQQAYIDQTTLLSQLLANEYVLLGEKHDNPIHHQHQTWVIHELAKAQRQVSVAFEMIDHEQGALLAKHQIKTVDQLIAILITSKTNWDYEQHYKALFAEVIAAGYRIDSANLDSKQLMQAVMQGENELLPAYKKSI